MKLTRGIPILIAALLTGLPDANAATGAGNGAVASFADNKAAAKNEAAGAPAGERREGEKPRQQPEPAKAADEKRAGEEANQWAMQAEATRKQDEVRLAREKKKKDLLHQQAEFDRRCVIKQAMSDAEIARCR